MQAFKFLLFLILFKTVDGQDFLTGGDIFNDGLANPCEEVDKWLKNATLGRDHGLAFAILHENCITVKILRRAMSRVNEKLGSSNLPIYEVDRFLQHSKPGNAGDLFMLTAHMGWVNALRESQHTFTIDGVIKFSWIDLRFSWAAEKDSEFRKVDRIFLHGHRSVWLPDLVTDQDAGLGMYSQISSRSSNPWAENGPGYSPTPVKMQGVHPVLYRNGTVQAPVGFIGPAKCSMNFKNYPADQHTCCTRLSSQDYPKEIKFMINNTVMIMDTAAMEQPNWKLLTANMAIENVNNSQYLKVCIDFQRFSNTIFAETIVPLVATLILVVFIPLFLTWKIQLYFRMLVVILLLMNFQYLLLKSREFEYGNQTPTIVHAYNAVIWITVVSLIISTTFYGLSRREYSLPPNHKFFTLCKFITACFTCSSSTSKDMPNVVPEKKHSEDWYTVFKGLNTINTIICSVIYTICILVFVV